MVVVDLVVTAPRPLVGRHRHEQRSAGCDHAAEHGRVIGLVAAAIGAVGALLDVGGAHPWWALGIFAICLVCIHGLLVLGEPEEV
jgi:hypothetical protein